MAYKETKYNIIDWNRVLSDYDGDNFLLFQCEDSNGIYACVGFYDNGDGEIELFSFNPDQYIYDTKRWFNVYPEGANSYAYSSEITNKDKITELDNFALYGKQPEVIYTFTKTDYEIRDLMGEYFYRGSYSVLFQCKDQNGNVYAYLDEDYESIQYKRWWYTRDPFPPQDNLFYLNGNIDDNDSLVNQLNEFMNNYKDPNPPDPEFGTDINSQIARIQYGKIKLKEAIEAKGINIPVDTTIDQYYKFISKL